ncbi:hypothetical protein [Alteromonas sp. CYL-A6]|uniref:hypothetical protein n=1 Tax=Alteromonas nitratireducens TaxID=3390813 RepID=UPI0034B5649F
MKLLFLDWLSILFFWGTAFFFCFVGSEVGLKYWKRKLIIGTPFFALFVFLVQAFGVPRYFVYDHIKPLPLNGELHYPAVKNHIIFQGASFKEYGVISKDLKDFKSNEKYFSAFNVAPLDEYPSVIGIKSWVNEIILVSFFVLWLIFLNKLHNASAASELYREARKNSRIASYQSYLNASQPIRFLQPIKRRHAKRELFKIRQIYLQSMQSVINMLFRRADELSKPLLAYLAQHLNNPSTYQPALAVQAKVSDVTTQEEKETYQKNVDYGPDYFMPDDREMSVALTQRLVKTLNQFLPETFFIEGTSATNTPLIELTCNLACRSYSTLKTEDGETGSLFLWFVKAEPIPKNNHLILRNPTRSFPPNVAKGKQDRSRIYCSAKLAQLVLNDTLFGQVAKKENDEVTAASFETKLAELKQRQNNIFDTIIDECKSVARDTVLAEGVNMAIKKNEVLFDSLMADMHVLIAEHADIYASLVAQEAIGGLLESVAEVAGE